MGNACCCCTFLLQACAPLAVAKLAIPMSLDLLAGWSYQKKGLQTRREGNVTIYGIPYSEHSSFAELRDCVKRLKPKRIIPTVNCPDAASARAIVDRFADLMDLSRDKSRLDSYFGRTASAPASTSAGAHEAAQLELAAQDMYSQQRCEDSLAELQSVKQEQNLSYGKASDVRDTQSDNADCHQADAQPAPGHAAAMGDLTAGHSHSNWEEGDCCSAAAWEDADTEQCLQSPGHEGTWQGCKEQDNHAVEQLLPMRQQAGPAHAHSAPAALSPQSNIPDSRLGCHASDGAALDGLSAQNRSSPVSAGRLCDSPGMHAGTDISALAGRCFNGELQSQQCTDVAANEASLQPGEHHRHSVNEQPISYSHIIKHPVPDCHLSLTLLNDVDIAEQSRILHEIQQQQLYSKQCLTSKKRQMTLGAFVAPKRLK